MSVVDGEVESLQVTGDRLTGVWLASGQIIARDAVLVSPRFTTRVDVLVSLGAGAHRAKVGSHVVGSYVAADPTGTTAGPGVWVAGNVADLSTGVISAASAGSRMGSKARSSA